VRVAARRGGRSMPRRAFACLSLPLARAQGHAASIAVVLLVLFAVALGQDRVSSAAEAGADETAGNSMNRVHLASAAPRFSPFDDLFRQHAGDQAGNDELIAIIAAAIEPESGGNPERVGDEGKSVGLFQIHEIHGLSWAERADPDRASAFMVPRFIAAYNEAKAEHPHLSGADLASLVAAMAERPEGWTDPGSVARTNYRESYLRLLSGGQRPQARAGQL
jgi:hypothetical protein